MSKRYEDTKDREILPNSCSLRTHPYKKYLFPCFSYSDKTIVFRVLYLNSCVIFYIHSDSLPVWKTLFGDKWNSNCHFIYRETVSQQLFHFNTESLTPCWIRIIFHNINSNEDGLSLFSTDLLYIAWNVMLLL